MPELRVAVLGAAGYAGGELLRLLLQHPEVVELRAFSASHAGRGLAEAHPALAHLPAGAFEAPDPAAAASWAEVLFLALPHGRSQELMGTVLERDPALVIDLAADFRIRDDGLYRRHYGEHAAPGLRQQFVYALADVLGRRLEGRRRLAVPGCFATATLLGLWPFAAAGFLEAPPVVFAVTGSTGSGAVPRETTHHPARANNFFGYAAEGHRHEAEIAEQLATAGSGGSAAAVRLLVHSAPLVRGIHATTLFRPGQPLGDPVELLDGAWAGRPFVRVVRKPPRVEAVAGTNFAHVHAAVRGSEIVVYVAIDNLVKGTAGQAVQAMNLALGLDETLGLGFPGLYPV
ncbi:MAG: N-acetyl-gamma-glutamyl-phosphate reductase [Acidobacteria bacterium]|nr:N-acetyl-gamma-glutamyl-phosphate reductase [Acidobacteriota bacterium]